MTRKVQSFIRGALTILTFSQVCGFLLDGPFVLCPNPAEHCLTETFNRVFENLGCLGCQSGCQPGYVMTANPKYYVKDAALGGTYDYQGVSVPRNKNVSEPQWLCIKGDNCSWGFYMSKQGNTDTCAYCGEGCLSCSDYKNCDQCILGYRARTASLPDGQSTSVCVSSGVKCPGSADHCQHDTYVSQVVGCQGCMYCDEGFVPTSNPDYRRAPENVTSGYYDFQGVRISGRIEITEPRYTCEPGPPCPQGWHNTTVAGLITCEIDTDDTTI